MKLYTLNLYDMIEEYKQEFFIGVFSSYEKAVQVAKTMLKEVLGFKDYDCKYEIEEKNINGSEKSFNMVSIIWGWNEDEDGNPIDIIESDLYINHNEAEAEFDILQAKCSREEWSLDQYTIDKVLWQDGFLRFGEGKS